VDSRGYFPTHNLKFSRPLTGQHEVDVANNRTKRIFMRSHRVALRFNRDPFFVADIYIYKRGTGEVMHGISAPIFVHGRHWGGFRIGYRTAEQQRCISDWTSAAQLPAPTEEIGKAA
jgi:methyl-accepting chemotaxis protein